MSYRVGFLSLLSWQALAEIALPESTPDSECGLKGAEEYCGNCSALVKLDTNKYRTCDSYCSKNNLNCKAAYEDADDSCASAKKEYDCGFEFNSRLETSDGICVCADNIVLEPVAAEIALPGSTPDSECGLKGAKEYCGDCSALVKLNTNRYRTCDSYCSKNNLNCKAAYEDTDDNSCASAKKEYDCGFEFNKRLETSDGICVCADNIVLEPVTERSLCGLKGGDEYCGECSALINMKKSSSPKTCADYCRRYGAKCVTAFEDSDNSCAEAKKEYPCDYAFYARLDTSDGICVCGPPGLHVTLGPGPRPPPLGIVGLGSGSGRPVSQNNSGDDKKKPPKKKLTEKPTKKKKTNIVDLIRGDMRTRRISSTGNLELMVPEGAEVGDTLVAFISHSESWLSALVEGLKSISNACTNKTGDKKYITDEDMYRECMKGDFEGATGWSKQDELYADFGTAVYMKNVTDSEIKDLKNEEPSFLLNDKYGKRTMGLMVAIKGDYSVVDSVATTCDQSKFSLLLSVSGGRKGDVLIKSQAYEVPATEEQFQESDIFFARLLTENEDTGRLRAGGEGIELAADDAEFQDDDDFSEKQIIDHIECLDITLLLRKK